MGGPVDVPLTCSSHVVVEGVTVRAAWRPHLLPLEVGEVLGDIGLGNFGIVGRDPILLKDIRAPPDPSKALSHPS